MQYTYGPDWGWGPMFWMLGTWVVGGVLLVLALVFLIRAFAQPRPRKLTGEEEAERILRRRYARGEIDEAELHRRMEELRSA